MKQFTASFVLVTLFAVSRAVANLTLAVSGQKDSRPPVRSSFLFDPEQLTHS
jgi:hypothetical protein